MKIRLMDDVLKDLKKELEKRNKTAVRIKLEGFGCCSVKFDVVFDEVRENDEVFEYEGVKFVADKEYAFLINDFEVYKDHNGFAIGGRTFNC